MRHVTEYAPAKTEEYPSDIPQVIFSSFQKLQGFKFAIKINVKMGERFAFVTEEETNLLDVAVPENNKNKLHTLETFLAVSSS